MYENDELNTRLFITIKQNRVSYNIFSIITNFISYLIDYNKLQIKNFKDYIINKKLLIIMTEKSVESIKDEIVDYNKYVITDLFSNFNIPNKRLVLNNGVNCYGINTIFILRENLFIKHRTKPKVKKKSLHSRIAENLSESFTNSIRTRFSTPIEGFDVDIDDDTVEEETESLLEVTDNGPVDTVTNENVNNTLEYHWRPTTDLGEYQELLERYRIYFDEEQSLRRGFISSTSKESPKEVKVSNISNIYTDIKYNFGGIPAQVKGIVLNDKIFYSFEEANTYASNSIIYSLSYLVVGYLLENNVIKPTIRHIEASNVLHTININRNLINILPLIYKFNIKDYKISSELFGLKTTKSNLVNTNNLEWSVVTTSSNKLSNGSKSSYCISVRKDSKNYKFIFADCEFIPYNVNIKSYNLPKDKNIICGTIVSLNSRFDKKYNINELDLVHNKYKVHSIKENQSSKKISKDSNRRKLDIVNVISQTTGINYSFYAKHIKLYNNEKDII